MGWDSFSSKMLNFSGHGILQTVPKITEGVTSHESQIEGLSAQPQKTMWLFFSQDQIAKELKQKKDNLLEGVGYYKEPK